MVSKTDLCGSLHLIGFHVQMWRGYVYATLFSIFGKQPRDNADHWPQADLFEYFSKGFNPTSQSEEYHTKDQVRVKHHENLWNSCSRPTSCCTERCWVLLNYCAVMCPQTCTYLRGFSELCLSRLTIFGVWPRGFLPLPVGAELIFLQRHRQSEGPDVWVTHFLSPVCIFLKMQKLNSSRIPKTTNSKLATCNTFPAPSTCQVSIGWQCILYTGRDTINE